MIKLTEREMLAKLDGTGFTSLEGNPRPKYQATRKASRNTATLEAVVIAAAQICRCTPAEIRSKSRSLRCLMARQAVTYIARVHYSVSFREIGAAIGSDCSTLHKSTLPEAQANSEMLEPTISRIIAIIGSPK